MILVSLAIDYKTASIDVRAALSLEMHLLSHHLKTLVAEKGVKQAIILSTCNRTELYLVLDKLSDLDNVTDWWQSKIKQQHYKVTSYIAIRQETEVVDHLMRLAVGLSSMVLGEPQILGQLKQAYNQASLAGTVGSRLHRLFQQTFAVAKHVRHQTGIGKCPVSIACSAVSLAKKNLERFDNKNVLIVGAGTLGALIARHMASCSPKALWIANRTLHKAQYIAKDKKAMAYPLSQLASLVKAADIIIMALSHSGYLIDNTMLMDIGRYQMIIDLAVPCTVDPNVNALPNITLYSVDDIQGVIHNNKIFREKAAVAAEKSIKVAVDNYICQEKSLQSKPTITALRGKTANIIDKALQRNLSALEGGRDPKAVLTRFAHDVTNKLLHMPSVALKQAAVKGQNNVLGHVEEIFGLENPGTNNAKSL